MTADIQHAGRFLGLIEKLVIRIDEWGYSLALRFAAYDRAHGQARMVPGGKFSISCGFAVTRATHRWLTFAIVITPETDRWLLTAITEDEDEERGYFRWESPPVGVSSLDEFSAAFDCMFALLHGTVQVSEVAEALKMCGAKYA